jgi:hypothetical protein
VIDRNEASCREAELMKALKKSALNILVPPPTPDLPCLGTQQSAAIRNPLSMLTGNVPNNVPNLEEKVAWSPLLEWRRGNGIPTMIAAMQSVSLLKRVVTSSTLFLLL